MLNDEPNEQDLARRAAELRAKLPAELHDLEDDELVALDERAKHSREAVQYISDAINADARETATLHKGALVLVVDLIDHMESVVKRLTRDGSLGPDEIAAAVDAKQADEFLNSL
jgi:hypothetical protein